MGNPFKKLNRWTVFGWLLFFVMVFGLSHFSVYKDKSPSPAYAAMSQYIEELRNDAEEMKKLNAPPPLSSLIDTIPTYWDGRNIYVVPSDTARNSANQLRRVPVLTGGPTSPRYDLIWKPEGDSVIVVTMDTFTQGLVDSVTALQTAAAWGKSDPYLRRLPWQPSTDPDTINNEPAGFAELFNRPFSEVNEAGWDNNGTTRSGLTSDVTAPKSPPLVGYMAYENNWDCTPGSCTPGNWYSTASTNFSSRQADSIYVSYYLKLSDNWFGHITGVGKILFVTRDGDAAAPIVTSAQGVDSGAIRYQIRTQGLEARNLAGNTGANDTIYRGQWHKIENLFVLDTVGCDSCGIVKVWIDNVLTHDYNQVLLWNNTARARWWTGIKWNPVWGGLGDTVELATGDSMYQYIDNLYVSTNQYQLYDNEPSGMTPLVNLTFQTHPEGWNDLSADSQWALVDVDTWNPEKSTISSIAASPLGSGDSAGVAIFRPDQSAGTAPINLITPSNLSWNTSRYNELFWSHIFLVSENHYVTTTGVNKIGFVEVGDYTGTNGGSMIYWALTGGDTQDSFTYALFTQGDPDNGKRYTCDLGRVVKAGQWHTMEHYVKLNTVDPNRADSANADGVAKVWVDGTLCVDTVGIKLIGSDANDPEPQRSFSRIKWNPTYSSPSPPDTSFQVMTNLYVSAKRSDPGELPPGMTDTTAAWWHWNPQSYLNTDSLLTDTVAAPLFEPGTWSRTETAPADCRNYGSITPGLGSSGCNIYLDDTQGYGPFTKSMLYWWRYWDSQTYPDSLNPEEAQTTGVKHYFPGPSTTGDTLKEVWFEAAIKGSPGITGCSPYADACAHKQIFFGQKASNGVGSEVDNGRHSLYLWSAPGESTPKNWSFVATSHVNSFGYKYRDNAEPFYNPQGNPRGTCVSTSANRISMAEYPTNDGEWHTIRWYVKNATVEDTIAANNSLDSRVVVWYDGQRVADTDSLIHVGECVPWGTANFYDNGYLRHYALLYGRNKDHGAYTEIIENGGTFPVDEKWWTGYISVFTENPGWEVWADTTTVPPDTTPPLEGWWAPNPDSTAAVYWDYEQYTDTDDFKTSAASDGFIERLQLDQSQFIDSTVKYSPLGFTKSVRFDWVYADAQCDSTYTDPTKAPGCGNKSWSVGHGKNIPNYAEEYPTEMWAEFLMKTSVNFSSCNEFDDPCDHKTVFFQTTAGQGYGRWSWHLWGGNGAGWGGGGMDNITMGSPTVERFDRMPQNYFPDGSGQVSGDDGYPEYYDIVWATRQAYVDSGWTGGTQCNKTNFPNDTFPRGLCRVFSGWSYDLSYDATLKNNWVDGSDPYNLRDGNWHVVRMYAKVSDPNQYNGRMALWIDSTLVYDSKEMQERYGDRGSPKWRDYWFTDVSSRPDSTLPYNVSPYPNTSGTPSPPNMKALLIGRNKDHGGGWYPFNLIPYPAEWTESWWIQYAQIYTVDPGWPFWPSLCPQNEPAPCLNADDD